MSPLKANKKRILKITALILCGIAFLVLCADLIPAVLSLKEPAAQEKFRSFIEGLGFFGILLMLLLQTLQIVAAIIPGEPIEILLGMMYGTLGGLVIALLGIALGTAAVYFAVRRFGMKFVNRFVDSKAFDKLAFLKNPAGRDSLVFLLFFIPGTPKDILTYFVPFIGMPFFRFVIIASLARIPSVITSTLAGAELSSGNLVRSLVIFAVTGVIGLAGILIHNTIIERNNRSHEENPTNGN